MSGGHSPIGTPSPPRAARRLLDLCVPSDSLEAVTGDLEELFHDRARLRGLPSARAWFWVQAISFSARFLLDRARDAVPLPGRGIAPSWLDVKLGARMLVKSPLLTLTGCVAIATAIGINAGFHEFMRDMRSLASELDVDERIVRFANYDIESGGQDPRLLEDLGRWREGLETVEDIGAALHLDMSLAAADGRHVKVDVAEMSASGFRVAGVVPVLGRPLQDSDDGPGAEPVVVLGHEVWQRYLAGAPDIVGSVVRLGEGSYRVVGVTASGFAFPRAQDVWVNFRRDPRSYPPRTGHPVTVFGRIAPGRTLEEAQAEVEQLGALAAADSPETHARLRPSVVPYAESFGITSDQLRWGIRIARTLLVMLLIVACANIATLVFARNADRESEIAVRNALGAGRGRIVTQLFAEAMVLALVSAAVGIALARWALIEGSEIFWNVQRADPPFWWDSEMSLSTVLYSLALAALGAGVVGILPALRATGRGAHATLQRAASGGGTLDFGRLPTAVIVAQIALTVAFIPLVLNETIADFRERLMSVSFPTERYLTARLLVDSEVQLASAAADVAAGADDVRYIAVAGVTDGLRVGPALLDRYKEMRDHVAERVRAEPGVRKVALTSRLPGLLGQSIPAMRLEVSGQPPRDRGWYVRTASADLELFDVVGRSMVDGRAFSVADYGGDERVALVNQAFVEEIFAGRSPVGHLVRAFDPDGDDGRAWTEIVGVVPDDVAGPAATEAQIYLPLAGAGEYPVRMLIEVEGDPVEMAPRLRALVAEAEPGLIVDEVSPLEEIRRGEVLAELFFVFVLGFVALVTMLLATAGVYALMSFIVARRTREIGIRTALGAEPARVVKGVFLRTFVQLGSGVVLGLVVVGAIGSRSMGRDLGPTLWLSGAGVSAVLVTVGLVGCATPVMRALRVPPTEALRADG